MTSIEWTRGDDGTEGRTWNPIRAHLKSAPRVGWFCVPVTAGCAHCYAGAMNRWRGNGLPYKAQHLDDVEFFLHEETLLEPLTWRKPRRVFPCSMTDLYGPWVSDAWIDKIKAVEAASPQHTYIELTKRPDRMRAYHNDPHTPSRVGHALLEMGRSPLPAVAPGIWPLANVWAGCSCSEQADVDAFLPEVLQAKLARRVISFEPLLEDVRFLGHALGFAGNPGQCVCGHGHGFTRCPNTGGVGQSCHRRGCSCRQFRRAPGDGLHWALLGFESGGEARDRDIAILRNALAQCRAAGIAPFVKQLGPKPWDGATRLKLKDRKGGDPAEWPADLRVREFPPAVTNTPAAAEPRQLDLLERAL